MTLAGLTRHQEQLPVVMGRQEGALSVRSGVHPVSPDGVRQADLARHPHARLESTFLGAILKAHPERFQAHLSKRSRL